MISILIFYSLWFLSQLTITNSTSNFSNISSVSLQTNYFQNKVREHYWCSNPANIDDNFRENPKVLISLLESGTVVKSDNSGYNFTILSLKFPVSTIQQHPSFPNMLYFFSFSKSLLFLSKNCGSEIISVEDFSFPIERMIFNHGDPMFLLVKTKEEGYFSSDDSGEKWYKLEKTNSTGIKKMEWAHHQPNLMRNAEKQRMIAQIEDIVLYSDNFFFSAVEIQRNVTEFGLRENFLIMLVRLANDRKIMMTDILNFKDVINSIHSALLPRNIHLQYFSCLPLEDILYVLIGPQENNLTLVTSPTQPHFKFVSSLTSVLSPKQIHIVQSLTGILIANQMFQALDIQTKISFDKGTTWRPLKLNNSNESLHLDLEKTYSSRSSVGLMISTGNAGKRLTPSEFNTYLSRNGGITWFEIKKGRHFFVVSDISSLIILVPEEVPTNKLYYSWNQGLTFKTHVFSENLVHILNISMEPNIFTQKLIIFGEVVNTLQGVVFSMQFSQRICQGVWQPNALESDYETWIPENEFSGCVLGRKMSVVRRKREAECFNPELDRPTIDGFCECRDEDYQCDYGFTWNASQRICEKEVIQEDFSNECVNGYMTIYTGYRKIPGDDCFNGVEKGLYQMECNDKGSEKKLQTRKNDWKDYLMKNYFFIIVIIMIVLLCCFHRLIEEYFSGQIASFKLILENKLYKKKESRFVRRLREDKNFERISEVNEDQETSSLIV